jgi:hypothetical protein
MVWWAAIGQSRPSSMGAASRISWGGISREDVSATVGEDGIEAMPYFNPNMEARSPRIDGAEQEMGWDPKSGKWALRPVSMANSDTLTTVSPTLTRPSTRGRE